jgi:hypothetical protein
MGNFVAVAVALAVVAWIVLWLGRRADFVVRLRGGRATASGRLSEARRRELERFLRDDLALAGPVTIRGRRLGGRLSLAFDGALTPGQAQRIRNFLLTRP